MNQAHDKMQVFSGPTFEDVAEQVEQFALPGHIEAKSIGVLCRPNDVVICLGYVDNAENGYRIKLEKIALGPEDIEIEELQKALSWAVKIAERPILCHDLFEYQDGSVGVALMTEAR